MNDQNFEAFGFAEPLTRALTQCAYTTPTPIQVQGLPPQLAKRDLMALAETGSGKTAAFVLPILNQIAESGYDPNPREVVALILAPTRELAVQIDGEVASLSRNMRIRRAVVLGGVSKGPQINALKRGVHVLVATPGRLLDHVNSRHADLRSVRTFVLDEADRMFDMGFIRDIRKIAALLPRQRRTAMFSATMPPEIRSLANELLTEQAFVDLSPKQVVVDRIEQKVMLVRGGEKQSRLHTLLADDAMSRVIVFTRTKRGADKVTDRLAMAGIGAIAIHGNKAQNARQRALNDFSAGHVRVLVATDIAARGIDVSGVTHVVNFDIPTEAETYVHRIGRTARKGTNGIAISLCDPSERGDIAAIERLMRQKIEILGDCGGADVPMPENRPHHSHDAPRREGAHRKGPSPQRNGDRSGGRSSNGRPAFRSDAPRGEARSPGNGGSGSRRPEEAGSADRRHAHGTAQADRAGQAPRKPWRPEDRETVRSSPRPDARADARPSATAAHGRDGAERRERPRFDTPRAAKPERSSQGAAASAGHRPERTDAKKPHRKGTGLATSSGAGSGGKTSQEPSHGPRPERSASQRSAGAGHGNWNGDQPPKFLRGRDSGARPGTAGQGGRHRPARNPAA